MKKNKSLNIKIAEEKQFILIINSKKTPGNIIDQFRRVEHFLTYRINMPIKDISIGYSGRDIADHKSTLLLRFSKWKYTFGYSVNIYM